MSNNFFDQLTALIVEQVLEEEKAKPKKAKKLLNLKQKL